MTVRTVPRPAPEKPKISSLLAAPSGHLVGYVRVSTDEQIMDMQINALTAAGCTSIHRETASGAAKKRPQLDLAIKELQPGDTLVVWRLDRLARSVEEFHRRLGQIRGAGAAFRSLTENFDFSTAMGEFVLTIMAAVAQLERQITVKRTEAGMAAARARGKQIGAPVKFTPAKRKKAEAWLRSKVAVETVARRLDLSPGTIGKFKKELGL